jgi:hypothetical protein
VNQVAIVENKRLSPMLAFAAQMQKEREIARSKKAPRRRSLTSTVATPLPSD